MNDLARSKAQQPDRSKGVITTGENFRVQVRSWAELLEENRRRFYFYRDHLNHRTPADNALDATVSKYLDTTLAARYDEVS